MKMATLSRYICLCEKNNIYPSLVCESLFCMKVAAKKPVIFHALQEIFLPLLCTYY